MPWRENTTHIVFSIGRGMIQISLLINLIMLAIFSTWLFGKTLIFLTHLLDRTVFQSWW